VFFVVDRYFHLSGDFDVAQPQLYYERFFVKRFKQTGTQHTMNLNRGPDYFTG